MNQPRTASVSHAYRILREMSDCGTRLMSATSLYPRGASGSSSHVASTCVLSGTHMAMPQTGTQNASESLSSVESLPVLAHARSLTAAIGH